MNEENIVMLGLVNEKWENVKKTIAEATGESVHHSIWALALVLSLLGNMTVFQRRPEMGYVQFGFWALATWRLVWLDFGGDIKTISWAKCSRVARLSLALTLVWGAIGLGMSDLAPCIYFISLFFWFLLSPWFGQVVVFSKMVDYVMIYDLWPWVSAILCIYAFASLESVKSSQKTVLWTGLAFLGGVFSVWSGLFSWEMVAVVGLASALGWAMTRRASMIHLPQLMALFHSLVGLASVFLCVAVVMLYAQSYDSASLAMTLEWLLGGSSAAFTVTGSLVAGAQLSGWHPSFTWRRWARHSVVWFLSILIFSSMLMLGHPLPIYLLIVIGVSAALGLSLVLPIGGGDMPVVISVLNACSGWAILGLGLSLSRPLYVIVGSVVGCSGAVLSWAMCRGMNRSLGSVLWPSMSETTVTAQLPNHKVAQTLPPEDAAFLLSRAQHVVIIPGYGMAAAHAQHALQELAQSLKQKGAKVSYAIHSVAGRMPGHMNVLLAEAKVPYEWMMDDEVSQDELTHADVALVIGANDIVNTLALEKGSSLYGMPIFDLQKVPTVLIIKRSMGTGYAGLDNPLFYQSNTYMILGDAKNMCKSIRQNL